MREGKVEETRKEAINKAQETNKGGISGEREERRRSELGHPGRNKSMRGAAGNKKESVSGPLKLPSNYGAGSYTRYTSGRSRTPVPSLPTPLLQAHASTHRHTCTRAPRYTRAAPCVPIDPFRQTVSRQKY